MTEQQQSLFGEPSKPKRERAPKAPKKPVPKRTPETWREKSWPCGILAIDPATRSGWAIWVGGKLIASGEVHVDAHAEMVAVIEDAQRATWRKYAHDCVVLVLERPFGNSNSGTIMALGAAHHAWKRAWEAAGEPEKRRWLVYPATWRSRMFGQAARRKGEPEDTMHKLERKRARKLKVRNGLPDQVMPDEAPAICIGRVATRAPELRKVLPQAVIEW